MVIGWWWHGSAESIEHVCMSASSGRILMRQSGCGFWDYMCTCMYKANEDKGIICVEAPFYIK